MEEENVNDTGMPKQKNLLRMHTSPQQVCLPNRQLFLARYERVSRRNLPKKMTITRKIQIGPRNQRKQKQKGGSIFGNIVKLSAKVMTLIGILKKN